MTKEQKITIGIALLGLFVFYLITAWVNIKQNDRLWDLEHRPCVEEMK